MAQGAIRGNVLHRLKEGESSVRMLSEVFQELEEELADSCNGDDISDGDGDIADETNTNDFNNELDAFEDFIMDSV